MSAQCKIIIKNVFFYQLLGQIPAQCLLAPHEGPCRAAYRRWYYNKEKRKCMVFVYGGCEGNANNFYTKPACKIFCMQRNRSKVIFVYYVLLAINNLTKFIVPFSLAKELKMILYYISNSSGEVSHWRKSYMYAVNFNLLLAIIFFLWWVSSVL